ncbi:MAG: formylmethanofuran dehydrogenase subunit A [Candidatus Pacebacteria bacterium]|nr:formylmethanofuran dehydrogenase subunit A [Candidatus Paceibacterota bacterium]
MIHLHNLRRIDPQHPTSAAQVNGVTDDIWLDQGRIVAAPDSPQNCESIDLGGKTVMAGAIDIHSHIAGGKMNLGKQLMTADRHLQKFGKRGRLRSGNGFATPVASTTAYRYLAMGYTMAFEPAMVGVNSRGCHREMGDIPLLDRGAYIMLGNDDFLLRLLQTKAEQGRINDYVGWMIARTRAMGVKIVNPGGISAFKFNKRNLGLDTPCPHYDSVTPRQIVYSLCRAVYELGLSFPLHLHCNDLGIPGNVATTLATIKAAEGYPLHLTHLQFHSYGAEGKRQFSSAAEQIAEAVNSNPNVTVDVGQIAFGHTVTASGDTMIQYINSAHADPKRFVCMDIECDGGCGVVPFRYRDQNFVNALQWAIGLELFLLIKDPWRIFLTTDHPNGAPFTVYPNLIRLLMEPDYRRQCLSQIHPAAQKATVLGSLDRAYSLEEIAILTRAGPARILGLEDHGSLKIGAVADIVVYEERPNLEDYFALPQMVFRRGLLVARNGEIINDRILPDGVTHWIEPDYDRSIEKEVKAFFDRYMAIDYMNYGLNGERLYGKPIDFIRHSPKRRIA